MDNIEGQNVNVEKMLRTDRPTEINVPQESLIQIIWQRHWVVLLTVIACLSGMFIYLYKATPIYTSTSRLYVEQSGPKIITEQEGFMTQSKNYLYTQCELLKSTPIIAGAVDKPEIARMKTFDRVDNSTVFLKRKLNISVGKKDDIISVSLDSPYPKECAQIINKLVEAYISYHDAIKKKTASEVLKILNREKDRLDKELEYQNELILEFKQNNKALSLEDAQGNIILIQGLAQLSDLLTNARIEAFNAERDYKSAQLLSDDPDKLRQFAEANYTSRGYYTANQEQTRLRNELSQLQLQKPGLISKVNPEHPALKLLESNITQVKKQLDELDKKTAEAYLEVARQQWLVAQQRENELQLAVDEQMDQAQELSIKAAEQRVLQDNLKRLENDRDIIYKQIKELNVTEDVGALYISILESARPAEGPSKPQKPRFMAIALVVGLLLGVGLVLMLDWMDTRLRSADEISATLGVPVLGTIPSMRNRKDIVSCGQAVHQESTSIIAEAYKTIRTAVYFGVPDGQAKSLLVTSPSAGDGKSTLVSNLATAMAQAGQRTLVIDCDFRKPMQHTIFELEIEPGLSSILTGQEQLEKAIKNSKEKNLDILTCGPIPVNPSELLNSQAFNDIIEKLSEKYDRLLIDSPPVMPVADARILGAVSDVTLVVLRAEKSTRKTSEQARDGLLSVGTNILGAVVNDVHHKGRYGYYKGYRYGYYGYGYGYGHSGHKKGDREKKSGREPAAVN